MHRYLWIYSRTIGTGFTDEKDTSRTIRKEFTARIVVSHDTQELTERRYTKKEAYIKGTWLGFCSYLHWHLDEDT